MIAPNKITIKESAIFPEGPLENEQAVVDAILSNNPFEEVVEVTINRSRQFIFVNGWLAGDINRQVKHDYKRNEVIVRDM